MPASALGWLITAPTPGGDGAADQGGDFHGHVVGDGEAGGLVGDDALAEDAELAHLEHFAPAVVVQADGAVHQAGAGGLVDVAELGLALLAGGGTDRRG